MHINISKKNKTRAYASSLMAQRFSDVNINHSVLVWDLKNKLSISK